LGRIPAITVAYEGDGPDDPVLITLADMHEHCRPERVADLIDDLVMLCEDVQAARQPARPVLPATQGAAK
jgi:hypothetical protein